MTELRTGGMSVEWSFDAVAQRHIRYYGQCRLVVYESTLGGWRWVVHHAASNRHMANGVAVDQGDAEHLAICVGSMYTRDPESPLSKLPGIAPTPPEAARLKEEAQRDTAERAKAYRGGRRRRT